MKTEMVNSGKAFKNLHQELINGCKACDQKAQFKIFRIYYKAMYNTSLGIVNNTIVAEDIITESFLSAFENIDKYAGTVSFGGWLKEIVVSHSEDFLKKNKLFPDDIKSFPEIADRFSNLQIFQSRRIA